MVFVGLTVMFYRPVFYFALFGPGNRNHSANSGRWLFHLLFFLHVINNFIYHWLGRRRLQGEAQRVSQINDTISFFYLICAQTL